MPRDDAFDGGAGVPTDGSIVEIKETAQLRA
jgi:hypothetical protein